MRFGTATKIIGAALAPLEMAISRHAGTEHEATGHRAPTPGDAKAIGRSKAFLLREDWKDVKDEIMRQAVLRKFETHADIRQHLLNTGDE